MIPLLVPECTPLLVYSDLPRGMQFNSDFLAFIDLFHYKGLYSVYRLLVEMVNSSFSNSSLKRVSDDFKEVYEVRKTWLLSSRNHTTLVHGLSVVLHLRIEWHC